MITSKLKKCVVVAGHICLDISPVFPESCRGEINELFVPGKLINVDGAQIHLGGAVANTGLAMSFFGADVRLMGKVGEDDFGTIAQRLIKSRGIREDLIVSKEAPTSYTVVLALPGCDRMFLHCPGANDTFSFDDIDMPSVSRATLFHFGYPPLMKLIYSDNGRELTEIFRAVSEARVVTSLDLASVDPNSEAGSVNWKLILENTLPHVDIFAPSIEELLFMLDRQKYERLKRETGGTELTGILNCRDDVKPLADEALRMGVGIVLIKCGAPGLFFKTAGEERIKIIEDKLGYPLCDWPSREGFEASYVPERILSATGAGDVTIAAFLSALISGFSLQKSLQYAAASGACCLTEYDSLGGLKSFDEIQRLIDAGWKKNQPDIFSQT